MSKIKQTDRVKDYLERFGSITQWDALRDLGIMRLASRMSDLKQEGYPFKVRQITVKNRYNEKVSIAQYYIEKREKSCLTQLS